MAQPNALAKLESSNPTVVVQKQIASYLHKGTLHLPDNYSVDNALKNAWFVLQEVKTPDKKLALHHCTQASIASALMVMAIQGLDASKQQCYFIPYGQQLICQRGYLGDIMLVEQRLLPGSNVYSNLVHEGDKVEYSILRGQKYITKHEQSPDNLTNPIIAAYAGIVDADGVDLGVEYMDIERIKTSWLQSKTYKPDAEYGTHARFEGEMALRTVIRRRLKQTIRSSSDAMLADAIRRSQEDRTEAELDAQIALEGNGDVLTLSAPEIPLESVDGGQQAELVPTEPEPAPAATEPTAQIADDPYAD